MIKQKLAACVQMDKVTSFFYFDNKVSHVQEYRLMIKALSAKYNNIADSIKELHNYRVPQIIKIDITKGDKNYLASIIVMIDAK